MEKVISTEIYYFYFPIQPLSFPWVQVNSYSICLLFKSGDFEMHTSNQKQIERKTRKQALQIYAQ